MNPEIMKKDEKIHKLMNTTQHEMYKNLKTKVKSKKNRIDKQIASFKPKIKVINL